MSASFIKPMKAKKDNHEGVPKGDYLYEVKFDGIRAIIAWDSDTGIRIWSRYGREITRQFPELLDYELNLKVMCCSSAIFDAEIVCFNDNGVADFPSITSRLHLGSDSGRKQGVKDNPVTAIIFDILKLSDHELMDRALKHRKGFLAGTIIEEGPWELSQVHMNGDKLYAREKKRGAEGIIAKDIRSTYQPGRRLKDWLKVKIMYEEEVTIYGFTAGKGKRENQFGALLFCSENGVHQGNVGTGFTDEELVAMTLFLDARGPTEPNAGKFVLDKPFRAIIKGMKKNKSGAIREPVYVGTVHNRIGKIE